jgi:carboxymethylenebutenolidase
VERHREALPDMQIFTYPGAGHAFNRDVPGDKHYHEASAKLAWERTLAFLDQHVAGA